MDDGTDGDSCTTPRTVINRIHKLNRAFSGTVRLFLLSFNTQ